MVTGGSLQFLQGWQWIGTWWTRLEAWPATRESAAGCQVVATKERNRSAANISGQEGHILNNNSYCKWWIIKTDHLVLQPLRTSTPLTYSRSSIFSTWQEVSSADMDWLCFISHQSYCVLSEKENGQHQNQGWPQPAQNGAISWFCAFNNPP